MQQPNGCRPGRACHTLDLVEMWGPFGALMPMFKGGFSSSSGTVADSTRASGISGNASRWNTRQAFRS
jgi:hypothetical protein